VLRERLQPSHAETQRREAPLPAAVADTASLAIAAYS
jgi:hypothetical protein